MRKMLAPARILLVAAIFGFIAHYQMQVHQIAEAEQRAFARLQLFLGLRKTALEDHFRSSGSDVKAMSRNALVRNTLASFQSAWGAKGANASNMLRTDYLTNNPFPPGKYGQYNAVPDNSAYSQTHATFQPWARRFLKHFGYYDLFLIAADGTVLYSFKKEDDFGTNLTSGPYASSALGYTFVAAKRFGGKKTAFSDFEEYAPSGGAAAAFAGSAIINNQDEVVGVFIVQLPAEPIARILNFTEGLGKTGQTYVVGSDNLLRSQLRYSAEPTLLKRRLTSESITRALGGFSGYHILSNDAGRTVLSAYAPLELQTERWALIAETTQAEIHQTVETRWAIAAGILVALVVAILLFTVAMLLSFNTFNERRNSVDG